MLAIEGDCTGSTAWWDECQDGCSWLDSFYEEPRRFSVCNVLMRCQFSAKHNLFLDVTTRVSWLYPTRHKETSSCTSFQHIQGFQKHTSPTFILAFVYVFPSGCNPNPHLGWRSEIPTPNYWIRLVRVRLLRCPSSSPSSVISQSHKGQVASHKSPPHVLLNRAVHATSFCVNWTWLPLGGSLPANM